MVHGLLDLDEVEQVLVQAKNKTADKSLQETRKKVASMLDLDPNMIDTVGSNGSKKKKTDPSKKPPSVKKEKKAQTETHQDPEKDTTNQKVGTVDCKQSTPSLENDSSDDEDLPLAARKLQKR